MHAFSPYLGILAGVATAASILSRNDASSCTGFFLKAYNTASPDNNHFLTVVSDGGGYFTANATSAAPTNASCFHLNGTRLITPVPPNSGLPDGTALIASFLNTMPNPPPLYFFGAYEDNPTLICDKASGFIECHIDNEDETGYPGNINEFQFCQVDGSFVQIGNQTFSGCEETALKIVMP